MPLRQWTIEGRCNVMDDAKAESIKQLFRKTAIELAAALKIVAGEGNPKVIWYSSDFFEGVEEVEAGAIASDRSVLDRPADEGISDELAAALKDD